MSVPFIPAKPAFADLRVRRPTFVSTPPIIASELAALTGKFGASVQRMDTGQPIQDESGFYRLDGPDGSLFLKIVAEERRFHLEEAERIAAWLAEQEIRVNAAAPGYPRPWRGHFAVFAYPYVEACFATLDEGGHERMRTLGTALAGLHLALAQLPWAATLADAWARRKQRLETARQAVSAGAMLGPEPEILRARLASSSFELEGPVQPVHNDLHCANILFPCNGASPVILDFEDCRHSVLPPIVDVAKVLERFILVPVEDDAQAQELGKSFLSAYAAASGNIARPGDLMTALRAQSIRALCDLSALALMNRPPDTSEWHKFFLLLEMLERRRDLIAALEENWSRKAR